MDISKTSGRAGSKEGVPRSFVAARGHRPDDLRNQYEDLRERHRVLRHQLQLLQGERDKALEDARLNQENSNTLWKKLEDMKRERGEMQKRLEQKGFAQRGQVPRFEHENLAKRFDQACAQVRKLQHDKEQLEHRLPQERQDIEARYIDELKSLKASLEEAEQDRHSLRYRLSECKRENDRLNEQLAYLGPSDSGKREADRAVEQQEQLKTRVTELKREKQSILDKLMSANQTIERLKTDKPVDQRFSDLQSQLSSLRQERDELAETNSNLWMKVADLEQEIQRLRHNLSEFRAASPVRLTGRVSHGSSEEMLGLKRHRGSLGTVGSLGIVGIRGRSSQGSTDDDFSLHHDSDNRNSLTDLTAIQRTHSGHIHLSGQTMGDAYSRSFSLDTKKKLSSSTSNLAGDIFERGPSHSRLSEQNSRLRAKLLRCEKIIDELRREKQTLSSQSVHMEQKHTELESRFRAINEELESIRKEATTATSEHQSAKKQIEILRKEKGVAMRDNAASYQQSIQMETQLRELQAEKQILEQQRDIANKEREKVTNDAIALKRKLETIITQRQKDAKDLSAMRHLKDKAMAEMGELRKSVEDLRKGKEGLEEELARVQEGVHRAMLKLPAALRPKGSSSLSQDLHTVLERLNSVENEKKVINKKLFGPDNVDQSHSLGDLLHKIESLFQERDNLVLEIEALQQSSSKLNEDRIFELKQRIEDLLMDRDSLSTQNRSLKREVSSLSSKLVKTEQERDRLSIDCERLDLQCQQLRGTQSRLVEDHTKTLERVNELWKHKWPPAWDEAWEEKHVTVPLGPDGFAGFSVVGGRDQPQLPNPGAFIITTVNQNGPAEGLLRVGDILESVNGINLSNADHREAVRAVKESKEMLGMVLRRRRNAYPIQMGIVSAINAVPHSSTPSPAKTEEHEYSLYITGKESLGFRYDWTTVCTVVDVAPTGPATQILAPGDRIIKVNNAPIHHEKPSTVKKMMKPHKSILKLVIERSQKDCHYTGQSLPPTLTVSEWTPTPQKRAPESPPPSYNRTLSWEDSSTPSWSKAGPRQARYLSDDDRTQASQDSRGSYPDLGPDAEHIASGVGGVRGERGMTDHGHSSKQLSRYHPRSRESYSSSRGSHDSYSQETQSQDSTCKPTKLVSVVTCIKSDSGEERSRPPPHRPVSDGVMYGNYNERRIEYEEVLLSERTDSQYSQSESYLSEGSYDGYGLSSSQSIDLTFHSVSLPTHNRLTVDTVMTTQNEPPHSQQSDEEGFFSRDEPTRTTFRTRNSGEGGASGNSNTNNSGVISQTEELSESQLSESQLSYPDATPIHDTGHKKPVHGFKRRIFHMGHRHRNKTMHGSRSLTKLSSSSDNLSRGSVTLGMRGKSRSNLSLGRAPSMTSVMEEPRRSTSTSNVSDAQELDPLADATYIRANFTYIPRNPKELSIKTEDVFHIHDEAPPERFRSSFWVSRLNADGTDEQIGAIPNSMRAQEYLEAQGESLDIALYEEVEAYTGSRPVLIFGALADQVVASLLESYPKLFYLCPTDTVEGVARITEARLRRDVSEGKIVDFRRSDGGFEVIRREALNGHESKGKHCLLTGTVQAMQSLKSIAPPITFLVKAMTEESITTFSPEHISAEQAKEVFDEVTNLQEQHGHEFSASLFLIYMHTLMSQIEDIVRKEDRNQAWVPISRQQQK